MKQWDIKVLYLGKISANLSMFWPGEMPPLEKKLILDAPYLGFLLQNGNRKILVDTGISDKFIVDGKAWGAFPAEGGRRFLIAALENEGAEPESIDTLLFTHLHNDHAANTDLFPNARIIIQKDEWQNLLSPLPLQTIRKDYDPSIVNEINQNNVLMIDGDVEITEGIRLLKTPGHTAGSQSVAVNTKKGIVVLIGDLCLLNFMLFPGTTQITDMEGATHNIPVAPPIFGPAIPHLLTYNYYDFYKSIYKVKSIATCDEPGYIIPGHEPSLVVSGI